MTRTIFGKVMWVGKATVFLVGFAAILALLLALDAKPAQAWEVHVSITGAGQVTETTPANLVGSGCVTSATNPTGTVGVHCYPGDPNGAYGSGWDVDYVATAKPGYRFDRWQSDGSTTTAIICDRSTPAATTSTYTGATCKFRTWENLQTRAVFVDDTAPSMASLTGPNQVVNGPATFSFSASADPTFRHFECRVGGVHEWQTCSSGHTEDPASAGTSGTYTLQVRAVDWSGNRSGESTWTWTVDKVTPETSLTSGPSGTVASTSAAFEFNSNEQGTFRCSLDGMAVDCSSPHSYTNLAQGEHTFQVWAKDAAGNVDQSPASRTWKVDTTAPNTTITSGPPSLTRSTSASFGFSSSEAGSRFQCSLDGSAFASCSSPKSYTNLKNGSHTFRVRAIDAVGSVDATPASRAWRVDTIKPTVSGMSPRHQSIIRDTTPTIKATVKDNLTNLQKANIKLYVNGKLISATKYSYSVSTDLLVYNSPRLAKGKKAVKIVATDAAGNVGTKSWYFTIK